MLYTNDDDNNKIIIIIMMLITILLLLLLTSPSLFSDRECSSLKHPREYRPRLPSITITSGAQRGRRRGRRATTPLTPPPTLPRTRAHLLTSPTPQTPAFRTPNSHLTTNQILYVVLLLLIIINIE